MKRTLLTAALALVPAAALAQEAPQPKPASGPFQICLWPNPCGSGVSRPAPAPPPDPKAEPAKPAPVEAVAADPLSRAIVRGDGGLVSVIRLKPEHTGVDHEQIVTRRDGLRDALAPAKGAALPASAVPPRRDRATGAAEEEWASVDSTGAAAGQLNGMRAERKALSSGTESAHAAGVRQFKDSK